MKRELILVCDDNPSLAKSWADKIESNSEVSKYYRAEPMFETPDHFLQDLSVLAKRQFNYRANKSWMDAKTRFDEASIVVIDFDLYTNRTFVTGEALAYLTRVFSECKIIVGLNQFGNNSFDLTLKGHPESYCDFNVGNHHLNNPGLWLGSSSSFRPWSWPNVRKSLEIHKLKVDEVTTNLRGSIIDTLGLTPITKYFAKSTSSFLGQRIDKLSFLDFALESKFGFHQRDRKQEDELGEQDLESISRFCASRITKWLLRLVLPGQDVLVDAPHLVSRFPSLIGNPGVDNLDVWNKTTILNGSETLGIDLDLISEFKFMKDYWLSRPTWFWPGLSRFETIVEVQEPWTRTPIDVGFCEDISLFFPREECIEFIAEVDSPYLSRYVRKQDESVEYEPKVRLIIPEDD